MVTEDLPAQAATLSWPPAFRITQSLPLQAGAADPTLSGTACWSVGSCVSVGEDDVAGGEHPIVITYKAGATAQTAAVNVPSGAATGANATASLDAVSCTSAGACVAVGDYEDTSGIIHGLVLGISTGKVGAAVAVNPIGASGNTFLRGVSCPPAGTCVAVGTYGVKANLNQAGVIVTIPAGKPSSISTVALPANANTTAPLVTVNAVSCWGSGACIAAGQYMASSGSQTYPFVDRIANGLPSPALEAALPTNAYIGGGGQQSGLNAVSCQATGVCVAAGEYVDTAGGSQPLVVPITVAGRPAATSAVRLPANAASAIYNASLNAIGCGPTGACKAVGSYVDSAGSGEPLAISVAGRVVSTATEAKLPSNALAISGGLQAASLSAVTCPESGACLAVGEYDDSSGNQQGLLEPILSGTSVPSDVSLPTGVPANPDAALGSVACTASASCVTAGTYHDVTAQPQSFQTVLQAGLTITNSRLPKATAGIAYDAPLAATGGWDGYSWSIVSGRLPAGLKLNAKTGLLSGKPRNAAKAKLRFRITNTIDPAQSVTKSLSLTVVVLPVARLSIPRDGLKLSDRSVRIDVHCAKGTACHGSLQLVYAHEVKLKPHGQEPESTVILSSGYSLKAGRSRTLKAKLTAAGTRFLTTAKTHRLSVTLELTVSGGAPSSKHTTFVGPPTKKSKKPRP